MSITIRYVGTDYEGEPGWPVSHNFILANSRANS